MSGIIEKLGIKKLEIFSSLDGDRNAKFRYNQVRKIEKQHNEMLKALIWIQEFLDKENIVFAGNEPVLNAIGNADPHNREWIKIKEIIK